MQFSIVIPTFNREKYLRQTIDSALQQDFGDFEILVVDNASTDGTPELMRQYEGHPRLRYVRNERNIGMVGSWRRAVFELLRGDWFMILSDDDYLIRPDYLQQAATLIAAEPGLKLVYGDGYVLYEGTGEMALLDLPFSGIVEGTDVFASRGRVKPQDFTLCNVLFRRDLALTMNAFSDANNLSCDTELFLLSCLQGKVGVVKGAASVYRIHASNLLKTARVNPQLCNGALGSLVNPYLAAHRMGRGTSAETMRVSSQMDREIVVTMLKVACLDYPLYRQASKALLEQAPVLAGQVMGRMWFRAAILLCRMFPWLYSAYIGVKDMRATLLRRMRRNGVAGR